MHVSQIFHKVCENTSCDFVAVQVVSVSPNGRSGRIRFDTSGNKNKEPVLQLDRLNMAKWFETPQIIYRYGRRVTE